MLYFSHMLHEVYAIVGAGAYSSIMKGRRNNRISVLCVNKNQLHRLYRVVEPASTS